MPRAKEKVGLALDAAALFKLLSESEARGR